MHDRKKTLTCCYAREVGARGFHEASFASQRSSRSSRNASSMRRLMSCARLVIADDDAKHLERIALIRKQLPAVSDDVTAKRPYLKDLVANSAGSSGRLQGAKRPRPPRRHRHAGPDEEDLVARPTRSCSSRSTERDLVRELWPLLDRGNPATNSRSPLNFRRPGTA